MPSERRSLAASGLRVASVGVAGVVLAVAAAAAGLGVPVPVDAVSDAVLAVTGRIGSETASAVVLVGLPAALVATLLARAAVARTPADVALAAFATPCLLACAWAVHAATTGGGVAWGRVLPLATATPLALVVVADAVAARVALAEARAGT